MIDIEEFRNFCLSLEGTTEKTPFGNFARKFDSILVFYVCGHMFCMLDMDDFTGITVKADPERIAALHATRGSCSSQRNMNARYWIQLYFGGDISDNDILDMVRQSYEIVKAKYTRKSKSAVKCATSSSARREDLPALIESTDRRTGINTLWRLTRLSAKDSEWLQSMRDYFIDLLLHETDPTKKRLLMQLLRRRRYYKKDIRPDFLDFCLSKINAESEPYAIRSYCIYCAWEMCRYFPELRAELAELLNMLSARELPPGLRCAAKKVLANISNSE